MIVAAAAAAVVTNSHMGQCNGGKVIDMLYVGL